MLEKLNLCEITFFIYNCNNQLKVEASTTDLTKEPFVYTKIFQRQKVNFFYGDRKHKFKFCTQKKKHIYLLNLRLYG
jgi:hypothetical protein